MTRLAVLRASRLGPAVGGTAAVLALSGCGLLMSTPNDPEASTSATPEPGIVDEVVADLEPLTGDPESIPTSEEFFDTMLDAGYEPEALEVTIDSSPLGNEVPSKMFGVKTDEGCVVGEIRGGFAKASLMRPSESTDACLFGEVERPEGVDAPEGEARGDEDADNGEGHIPGEDINGGDSGSADSSDPGDSEGSTSDGADDADDAGGTDTSDGTDTSGGTDSTEDGGSDDSSEDGAPALGGE